MVSQPSAGFPLQLAKPLLQPVIVQLPDEQPAVPFAAAQVNPHPPQLLVSLLVPTSQPSPGIPLQLAKPLLQPEIVQVPDVQPGVPFGAAQVVPHPPQLFGSLVVAASQPSTTELLQSVNPALQEPIVQVLDVQPAVPFAAVQMVPQLPQLAGLLSRVTSQPSATRPLQLP